MWVCRVSAERCVWCFGRSSSLVSYLVLVMSVRVPSLVPCVLVEIGGGTRRLHVHRTRHPSSEVLTIINTFYGKFKRILQTKSSTSCRSIHRRDSARQSTRPGVSPTSHVNIRAVRSLSPGSVSGRVGPLEVGHARIGCSVKPLQNSASSSS